MLFIFIDILERLLAWLRSFASPGESHPNHNNDVELRQARPRPDARDVRNAFDVLRTQNNHPPLEEGVVVDRETASFVVSTPAHGEMAASGVWAQMNLSYGTWYDVRTSDKVAKV